MIHRIAYLLCICFFVCPVYCQQEIQLHNLTSDHQDSIEINIGIQDDLFDHEEPLQITLTFDIRDFTRNKDNPENYDAAISIKFNEKDSITENIKLKARGLMRRSFCDFPPIMLNLKNVNFAFKGIDNQSKLKLVTYCKKGSIFESYVLREYLAYKLYSLITPFSFKVRLVQVTYIDIHRPNRKHTAYGFLIEVLDKLAERNSAEIVDESNIKQTDMIPVNMARTAVFQYMIGNTDWGIPGQHNIRVVRSLETISDQAIPVPYDFDFSGFVGTDYAAPKPGIPIEKVTERYYQGVCVPEEDLIAVLNEFTLLQDQFLQTIDDFEILPNGQRKQASSYINSFLKRFRNQSDLVNLFKQSCHSQ